MYSYLLKQMCLPSKQDYEPDNILLPISQKECVNLRKLHGASVSPSVSLRTSGSSELGV